GAWAHLDRAHALAQAAAADAAHKAGKAEGPLHGVPVGIKDIFDTADMPTENGCALQRGRAPRHDAAAVALLREAGAVILGKTVTTELAYYAPGKTANPHDPSRTPGGSSSGSAAAVAAGMVPLAIGSQTNGSTIRPASFCGVFGYKPSHGLISRHGALRLSRRLDHVGLFARKIEDLALLGEALMRFDERDPDMRPMAPPPLLRIALEEPPVEPRLAFVATPAWDQAEPVLEAAFAELAEALEGVVDPVALPAGFAEAWPAHRAIMEADMAHNLRAVEARGDEGLSEVMRETLARGRAVSARDYLAALDLVPALVEELDELFAAYDAVLTPAAPGPAPLGREATGNPVFCTLWTLCGTPAVSVPLLSDENGLPIGVQLVGRPGDDARLLRLARWLGARLSG
ncbi:MAG: amidase, partial [Rhodospirillaceae bacterium]|nr:amidase [Rhodospirillaceae bacterium]